MTFALQAAKQAGLDAVYFLPERRPRHKQRVEHFGHRVAMLHQAVRPHPRFDVLELDDVSFSVIRTLPRLHNQFPGDRLVFLFGSDVVAKLPAWPQVDRLLRSSELVVGCRWQDDAAGIRQQLADWPVSPRRFTVFGSHAPEVSSGGIRDALQEHRSAKGLLRSVQRYSDQHWLYVSLA
jgi:nicotinate-nucleotide adenylyltransferase